MDLLILTNKSFHILTSRKFLDISLPLILALLPLIWTYPFNLLLYGQDYFSVLDPFTFSHNPLALYSGSSSMVNSEYVRFYYDGFLSFLNRIGLSYSISERLIIVLGTAIAIYGVFGLFKTLNRINGSREEDNLLAKVFASLFFIMNPFTMTVTWPFLENWTIFLIFLPFWFSFLLDVYYSDHINMPKLFLTCILGILLAPGVAGAFSVALLSSVFYFLLLEIRKIILAQNKTSHSKKILVVITAYLSTTWVLLPFLFNPVETGSQLVSSPDLNLFYRESSTTSVLNVMRLMGFTWVYDVPDKYPWINSLNTLGFAAAVVISLIFLGLLLIKRFKGIAILAPFTLILLFFMKGFQPPFENLTFHMFSLGGPFLILSNPYYFIGQYYVLFLTILLFALMSYLVHHVSSDRNKIKPSNQSLMDKAKILILLLLVASMAVSAIPFWTNQIYQPRGSNIDAFELPQSFPELKDFFSKNYEGPNYYALIIPVSPIPGAYRLSFNNNSFTDSYSLLSYFIPYPLISSIENEQQVNLVNALALQPDTIGNLLEIFNIKYVVVNPFSKTFTTYAPNGLLVNWTKVIQKLNEEIGQPTKVGDFLVYRNDNAQPVVRALPQLNLIKAPDFSKYLEILGSVNSSSALGDQILDSLWTNDTFTQFPANIMVPFDFLTPTVTLNASTSSNILAVMDDGSVTALSNASNNGGMLQVSDPLLASLEDEQDYYESKMELINSTFYSRLGENSSIVYLTRFGQPLLVDLTFKTEKLTKNNWVEIWIEQDDLHLALTVYFDTEANTYVLEFHAINDHPTWQDYVWKNIPLPSAILNSTVRLVAEITNDKLTANLFLRDSQKPLATGMLRFAGSQSDLTSNQGCNLTATPTIFPDLTDSTIRLKVINPEVQIYDFSIFRPLPIKYLLVASSPSLVGNIDYQNKPLENGNYDLKVSSGGKAFFVVIDHSYSRLWSLTSKNDIEVARADVNAYSNVFYINNVGTNSTTSLSVEFQSITVYMILVSAVELLVFSSLYVLARLRQNGRWHYLRYAKSRKEAETQTASETTCVKTGG